MRILSFNKPKSDEERAKEIREKLAPLFEQACEILNEAKAEGLIVSFNIKPDASGKITMDAISVSRVL